MRHRVLSKLLVCLAAAALAAGLYSVGVLDRLEADTVDARFSVRGTEPATDVAVVEIDGSSLSEIGERWPISRLHHARVVRRLRAAGVRQIAYDVQFTEPTNPRADFALFDAIADAPGTVLSTTEVGPRGTTNVLGGDRQLAKIGARAANTLLPTEAGGVIRRFPHELDGLESFAVATGEEVLGRQVSRDGFDDTGAYIDYHGPPGTVPTYGFADVMKGRVPARALRGKVVVVGASAPSLQDVHASATSGDELMAGPEIQANAISTVLRGVPLRDSAPALDLVLILLMAAVAPLASLRLPGRPTAAICLGALAAFLGGAYLAFDAGTVLSAVYPLAALAFSSVGTLGLDYLWTSRERRRTRALFARFVPEAVVADLVARSSGEPLPGSRMEATVMFCDLRGFTRFAEHRPAEQVVHVLNRYLGTMSEAILECGGTVVSFMGDGIMAVFGSPIERGDHADAAFAAARDILGPRLQELNRWLAAQGMGPFHMGVGLNSGEVMSGNVGSERRLEYAAIGDTTNVAARLESNTKGVPGGLLLGDSTYSRLTSGRELLREHGALPVSGREEPVTTWALAEPADVENQAGEAADEPAGEPQTA